jgi:hypothetical protein
VVLASFAPARPGDVDTLYVSSRELQARPATLPQLADVTADLEIGNPQVNVQNDRERAPSRSS